MNSEDRVGCRTVRHMTKTNGVWTGPSHIFITKQILTEEKGKTICVAHTQNGKLQIR